MSGPPTAHYNRLAALAAINKTDMLRATLTTAAATAALALLLMLITETEAVRVFPRTQRQQRQAKEVVDTIPGGGEGSLHYTHDQAQNRTLAIHGAGNGSCGVAAFDIG